MAESLISEDIDHLANCKGTSASTTLMPDKILQHVVVVFYFILDGHISCLIYDWVANFFDCCSCRLPYRVSGTTLKDQTLHQMHYSYLQLAGEEHTL